jgi:hypothetical protein
MNTLERDALNLTAPKLDRPIRQPSLDHRVAKIMLGIPAHNNDRAIPRPCLEHTVARLSLANVRVVVQPAHSSASSRARVHPVIIFDSSSSSSKVIRAASSPKARACQRALAQPADPAAHVGCPFDIARMRRDVCEVCVCPFWSVNLDMTSWETFRLSKPVPAETAAAASRRCRGRAMSITSSRKLAA